MSTQIASHRPATIMIAALALVTSGLLATSHAHAANVGDPAVTASKSGASTPQLKLSQDGFSTMRDVRAARIAIFNGDVKAAKALVDQATADIGKVRADERVLDRPQGNWVPIDGQLVIADDFVSTPQKTAHISAGNQKLKEGKVGEAVQALKLAEVDVGYSRVLMPLDSTRRQISMAAGLLSVDKYYEANMVLKAAEDGLVTDTVAIVEVPKNAAASAPKSH